MEASQNFFAFTKFDKKRPQLWQNNNPFYEGISSGALLGYLVDGFQNLVAYKKSQ